MSSAVGLTSTYVGYIASTTDALLLIDACLKGLLYPVPRRPHEGERSSLIKSGNVFIYEHSSGIKRWTDGASWSPSRSMGNFMIYRELEHPFPPGMKKRAIKRSRHFAGISKPRTSFGTSDRPSTSTVAPNMGYSSSSMGKETEKALFGSLVDSYDFREDGLMKKTISVTVRGISHHLVSYYLVDDIRNNKFTTPSSDPRFQKTVLREELTTMQNFRVPVDEIQLMRGVKDQAPYNEYPYSCSPYEMTSQAIAGRSTLLRNPLVSFQPPSSYNSNYGMTLAGYDGLQTSNFSSPFAPLPALYPASKKENYDTGGIRQRYDSIAGISPEFSSSVLSANTIFGSRNPTYDLMNDPLFSSAPIKPTDSKMSNESGYTPQSYYNDSQRASSHTQYPIARSLPMPIQHSIYDRHPYSYTGIEIPGFKAETTLPIGNESAGRGNSSATQQQWAITGDLLIADKSSF
ncbi:Gti1/Pac2 family protein [Amylocarpus encephaloides]|uniref:Gti1/Pac2 family protein n=1 Tax=Amylocarpus encephaloides TaxID=45428 RepID=A0A9P7YUG4_9HELO|nr:Gti1/Pac2 family protein [Amylocarpus encephaloides]